MLEEGKGEKSCAPLRASKKGKRKDMHGKRCKEKEIEDSDCPAFLESTSMVGTENYMRFPSNAVA